MSDCLVLNFTYEPLGVVTLKRAVRLLFARKAEIVHGDGALTSPSIAFPLPSIIRMLYYVNRKQKNVPLTKRNILLRDKMTCGYCGVKGSGNDLTVDHIQPKSRGGPASWKNLITACIPCNTRKRDRTPQEAGMPLRSKPYKPSFIPWVTIKKHTAPTEWQKYLFWNISIEERVG